MLNMLLSSIVRSYVTKTGETCLTTDNIYCMLIRKACSAIFSPFILIGNNINLSINNNESSILFTYVLIPEPTARSGVPGVSQG